MMELYGDSDFSASILFCPILFLSCHILVMSYSSSALFSSYNNKIIIKIKTKIIITNKQQTKKKTKIITTTILLHKIDINPMICSWRFWNSVEGLLLSTSSSLIEKKRKMLIYIYILHGQSKWNEQWSDDSYLISKCLQIVCFKLHLMADKDRSSRLVVKVSKPSNSIEIKMSQCILDFTLFVVNLKKVDEQVFNEKKEM